MTTLSFKSIEIGAMDGMGVKRVLVIMVVSIVCLATIVKAESDGDGIISSAPAPSPSQQPLSPINAKVYACGERCVGQCMKEASNYPVYTKCTTTCMEPCIRTLVDAVYSCTFGCTKTLSTQFATGMAEVEGYFGACYNSCKNN